ncbi:MAG: hypothetical protein AUJ74_06285 [Candidatus Omnitrophica bacterium CG1_02_44_16]|nr:MAG: hypothetical protein AUJ74_06285 [Candidatus Omnitrophica bacterium CG1_02_44_16]PIY83024.1 MAG: hypothetical protein COY78_03535 [Candidatus Omnitrophica bacterium CG_4_10_14_0_8_um_filter_44_12]PIZ83593.1 MAG: hypothetical protein COX96_07370 [Candidatus Omnitrophica bacterium CG_4_10_14_0_2_um_filter_44_9]
MNKSILKPMQNSNRYLLKIMLFFNMIPLVLRQLYLKSKHVVGDKAFSKNLFLKLIMLFIFLKMMHKNNLFTVRTCQQGITELKNVGIKEVVFYGAGNMTNILVILAKENGIKVNGIYDTSLAGRRCLGLEIANETAVKEYTGKIIINYFNDINEKIKRLQSLGVDRSNIVRLI